MIVSSDYVNIPSGGSSMRTFMARPGPRQLAGNPLFGHLPAHRHHAAVLRPARRSWVRGSGARDLSSPRAAGCRVSFDDEGRSRGMADAVATAVADFDVDAGSALEHLARDPAVDAGRLGAAGFASAVTLFFERPSGRK